MADDGARIPPPEEVLGGSEGLDLLRSLVALAPTNLEDPVHHRYEKPNYGRTVDRIARIARSYGLTTRIYDPLGDPASTVDLHGVPRPNLVADLDVGAEERVLILTHYDVVPVPAEQLGRWASPPHTLTRRADGRLYARGANDDLGSGVVAALLALHRLTVDGSRRRNVRLLVCCDEETGGEGGIEAMKAHDERLAEHHPDRFIEGDVALIPDGSPHATAGSCGVAFLDATFDGPVDLRASIAYAHALIGLHDLASTWRSRFASPDWPDHLAPAPFLTGRATLTKFDLEGTPLPSDRPRLLLARAETDAANQIAESVTVVFGGPAAGLDELEGRLAGLLRPPFRLSHDVRTSLVPPAGSRTLQVVGRSAHGGYPHRGHNPVPAAIALLEAADAAGWIDGAAESVTTFAVDLRFTPEMAMDDGVSAALATLRSWARDHEPRARIDAPAGRRRGGYALPYGDPHVGRLERFLLEELGEHGIFGEYGGTDASALATARTPGGGRMPALVFGSMDREAHIHEAEESVDPRLWRGVRDTIYRFIAEP
ncbi:MAG: M20/M25/M40 family metallo-hydrolase [Thermoplasmata archaeon]